MQYKLKSEEAERLVLGMRNFPWGLVGLLSTAAFTGLGVGLHNVLNPSEGSLVFLPLGLGLLFLLLALALASETPPPQTLIFERETGLWRLILKHQGLEREAQVPLSQIWEVYVDETVGGGSKPKVYYGLFIKLHDGSTWQLGRFNTRKGGQALAQKLQDFIRSAPACSEALPEPPLSARFRREVEGATVTYTWHNQDSRRKFFAPILAALLMLVIFQLPALMASIPAWYVWVKVGVTLFFLLMLSLSIAERFSTYRLSIDKQHLALWRNGQKMQEISLGEIKTLLHHFSFERGNGMLQVVKQKSENESGLGAFVQNPKAALSAVLKNNLYLTISGMDAVETLQLKQLLMRDIEARR